MTKDHSIELIQKQQEQIDILLKIVWKQFNIIERYHQPTIINTTPGESFPKPDPISGWKVT